MALVLLDLLLCGSTCIKAYSFLKSPQVILQSRFALPSEVIEAASSHTWFNLKIPEIDVIAEQCVSWKKDQKTPMHIFVYWSPGEDSQERYLLEHWQCSYTQKSSALLQGVDVKALYNKFVIMFRSLMMYAKVLPAYKAFRSQIPTGPAKLIHQISPTVLTAAFPFGSAKPEKVQIGQVETPFGTIELTVQYRKDVSFAMSPDRPEVIPAESIIPDYAPSLSNKIPIRTKPVSIQSTGLQRHSSSNAGGGNSAGGRQRAHTTHGGGGKNIYPGGRVEARSQPSLIDNHALSFSPPMVGAQSMWTQQPSPMGAGRERQDSEPPFPTFNQYTPSSVGGYSTSPRIPGGYSSSPSREFQDLLMSPRSAGSGIAEGERILTAVSPPSFSMYERAMHESPDPEFDGPVFSLEGSFSEDDVNSFVRFCQSKPVLMLIEDEQREFKVQKKEEVFQVKN